MPDTSLTENVSNVRVCQLIERASKAARDVRKLDNTACLKLPSVEGASSLGISLVESEVTLS